MASRGPAGTHLSAPNRKASISFATPKPNEVVSRQGGQLTNIKGTFMLQPVVSTASNSSNLLGPMSDYMGM